LLAEKVPTSKFLEAFSLVCGKCTSSRKFSQRHAFKRSVARTTGDIHEYLGRRENHRSNRHSLLRLYHDAEWIPERIPDEVVHGRSILGLLRMCLSKTVLEPAVGEIAAERTPLVDHAIAEGVTDSLLRLMSGYLEIRRMRSTPASLSELASHPEYDTSSNSLNSLQTGSGKSNGMPKNLDLLEILRVDIFNDICGKRPHSAMNYLLITLHMTFKFLKIEDELQRVRNPLYVRAYEQDPRMSHQKRVSLVKLVLSYQDEECMKIMAKKFQEDPACLEDHTYWNLNCNEPEIDLGERQIDDENDVSCTVM
jgi:hypothetical protein